MKKFKFTLFQGFWEDNRKSLLRFLGESHRGVKGFVKDENFAPIEGASMKVRGRDVGFQTTKEGEFWRILLPGIYTMEVFAEGFAPREVQFAIVEQNPTMLNVTLYPVSLIFLPSPSDTCIAGHATEGRKP